MIFSAHRCTRPQVGSARTFWSGPSILGLLTAALLISPPSAEALRLVAAKPETTENGQPRDPVEKMVTHLEKKLTGSMEVRIEAIRRVCGLKDDQKKELTTACKGAVERAVETWKDNLMKTNPGIGQQVVQMEPNMGLDAAISTWCGQPTDPAAEAMWINALAKVLDKDQLAKWTDEKDRRAARIRSLAIDEALHRLDRVLFLSEEQMKKLRPEVEKTLGDDLAALKEAAENAKGQGGAVQMFQIQMGGRQNKVQKKNGPDLSEDVLKGILSEAQIGHWPNARAAILAPAQRGNNGRMFFNGGW